MGGPIAGVSERDTEASIKHSDGATPPSGLLLDLLRFVTRDVDERTLAPAED